MCVQDALPLPILLWQRHLPDKLELFCITYLHELQRDGIYPKDKYFGVCEYFLIFLTVVLLPFIICTKMFRNFEIPHHIINSTPPSSIDLLFLLLFGLLQENLSGTTDMCLTESSL